EVVFIKRPARLIIGQWDVALDSRHYRVDGVLSTHCQQVYRLDAIDAIRIRRRCWTGPVITENTITSVLGHYNAVSCHCKVFAEAFIREEKERSVFAIEPAWSAVSEIGEIDRPADISTKEILAEQLPRNAVSIIEPGIGVKSFVAVK